MTMQNPSVPPVVELTSQQWLEISAVVDEAAHQFSSAEDPAFLDNAHLLAHRLPERLRAVLYDFCLKERPPGGIIVSGYQVDDRTIGQTPDSRYAPKVGSPTVREELCLAILASLLGEPFVFASQQDGRLIDDVVPLIGDTETQLGSSSSVDLEWHVEDAFHPYRPDYLVLMCLRNPDKVATSFASIDLIDVQLDDIPVLFERRFKILPDKSYRNGVNPALIAQAPLGGNGRAQISSIEALNTSVELVAALFGDPRAPYLRLDPFFMSAVDGDEQAQAALRRVTELVSRAMVDVVLQPGQFFVIDNYRAVHGRRSFHPRYDGTDRWLKRIRVTSDLRKSREFRTTPSSRLIL